MLKVILICTALALSAGAPALAAGPAYAEPDTGLLTPHPAIAQPLDSEIDAAASAAAFDWDGEGRAPEPLTKPHAERQPEKRSLAISAPPGPVMPAGGPPREDVVRAGVIEPAGQVSTQASLEPAPRQGALVTLRIRVPHNKRAHDQFSAYPYPVKPPRIVQPIELLRTERKDVRDQLLMIGYQNRSAANKPFPPGGWRWQYVFQAGLKKSGSSTPHFLVSMYPWANRMVNYCMPYIERLNAIEEQRLKNYERARAYAEKNYAEIEAESTRKGLVPLEVRMKAMGTGRVTLPAGTWWITGLHKTPGLTYYWYMPVTVSDGETPTIYLTEENALVIQGGW